MNYEQLEKLVTNELTQREEEGCDVSEARKALSKIRRPDPSKLEKILKDLTNLPLKTDFPYEEPSDLAEIRTERREGLRRIDFEISGDKIADKIYGGWLGRCAGCLLGKPAEGLSREKIEVWLKIAGAYPLRNFFPPLRELSEEAPSWLMKRCSRRGVLLGQIDKMVRDDDIDYTIINLHVLETFGFDFTTLDIGRVWLRSLPYFQVWSAGRAAYRNLVNGLLPPETATYMNPFRESLGGQIRADMWGYVAPGMPELGAELAHKDARLSQAKNGIYSEMFVSAMISAAFTTNDIEKVINIGLSEIPGQSRLAEAARKVMAWRKEYTDWEDCWQRIMKSYGHHYLNHSINNAAIVLLGLLYGDGDYEKSVTISVMSGLDTDCNGATTGSIVGVILGAENLSEKWIKPLNDRVESFVICYSNSQISKLAKRTFKLAEKALSR